MWTPFGEIYHFGGKLRNKNQNNIVVRKLPNSGGISKEFGNSPAPASSMILKNTREWVRNDIVWLICAMAGNVCTFLTKCQETSHTLWVGFKSVECHSGKSLSFSCLQCTECEMPAMQPSLLSTEFALVGRNNVILISPSLSENDR